MLHGEGISRRISLSFIAAFWLLVFLYSYFVMPHYKVVKGNSIGKKDDKLSNDNKKTDDSCTSTDGRTTVSEIIDKQSNEGTIFKPSNEKKEPYFENPKIPTLWQCMKTLPFFFLNVWLMAIYLAYHTFIGNYNPWVTKLADGDDETGIFGQ